MSASSQIDSHPAPPEPKRPAPSSPTLNPESPTRSQAADTEDPITSFGEVSLPRCGILSGLAGRTYASAKMTQIVLNENHLKYHWAFNSGGLHNHLAHHVLAAYSLGAPSETIRAIYDLQSATQRPMPPINLEITDQNFATRLGNTDAYASYLKFFHQRIATLGVAATIEQYLFRDPHDYKLLVRLVSGALHPFLILGYGVEFDVPAVVAEGLAQAAVHSPAAADLFEDGFVPKTRKASNSISLSQIKNRFNLTDHSHIDFASTSMRLSRNGPRQARKGLSAFTIVSHILNDPELAAGKANTTSDGSKFNAAVANKGKHIRTWCNEWIVDEEGGFEEIVAKTEELMWLATVLLCASSRPGLPIRLDFFIMHCLTSAIFLPSLVQVLSPSSQIKILLAHFRVMIAYWVSRGRPKLHIVDLLMKATDCPTPPNIPVFKPGAIERQLSQDTKGKNKEGQVQGPNLSDLGGSQQAEQRTSTVNPWPAIVASCCDHPDEHLVKAIRSLYYAASLFGASPPGMYQSALPGTDVMDGTIFIRAAGMIMDTMGWAREDRVIQDDWDRSALGFDEVWQE